MVIHVAAQNWYTTDVYSLEWQVMNFWHGGIVRWAVPVFVMISGALFLNPSKDISTKKLYTKYIFRIFTAFIFWAFVYACASYAVKRDALKAVGQFIAGYYHMWFLFMIVGLYMIVPFVRKIAESESLTKYFLVLAFFFAFLFPEAVRIISLFSEKYGNFAYRWVGNFNFQFVAGFTGYFLLGNFLNNAKFSQRTKFLIYAAGVTGFTATVLMSLYASRFKGEGFNFYGNHTVNVMCEAVAVFIFFRERLNFPARFMRALSQYSFGAYLVHAGVIPLLAKLGLNTLTFNPILSVPVISVIVFVISFTISAILNHIPVLKKYIV